jgi:hypothetical protein
MTGPESIKNLAIYTILLKFGKLLWAGNAQRILEK